MKKRKKKSGKAKPLLEIAEEIAVNETETIVEDLRDREVIRECISEGDVDDKDVVSRARLF